MSKLKWRRKALSLIAVLCLAFSLMPAAAFAEPGDGASGESYGYLYKGDPFPYDGMHYKFALYCVDKAFVEGIDFGQDITAEQQALLNDNAQVVYCMDSGKNEPPIAQASLNNGGAWPTYNKLAGTTENLLSGCTKGKFYSDEEIARGLAWVASNGYPNSTFQGDMSVSDYRAVTQWAVYHWSQGLNTMGSLQTAAQKEAAAQFMTVPDDFDASIHISNMSVYEPTANLSNPQWLFGIGGANTPILPDPDPKTAKVSLDGIKTMDGRDLADGEFTFNIEGDDGLSANVANNADGTIDFGEIEYAEDDFGSTFTYIITEVAGGDADVVYDTTQYKVIVDLSADGVATVTKYEVTGAGDPATGGNATPGATDEQVDQIVFANTLRIPVDLDVSKKDLGGKGVVGAALTITEGDNGQGDEVATWKTEADANGNAVDRKVSGLLANKVYTLTETLAPENYELAESIVFKIAEDGTVQVRNADGEFEPVGGKLTMIDGYASHEILFSKMNLGGEEIGGAEITVSGTELNGGAIEDISWTSVEGEGCKFGLKPGTYTFHEEVAPTGYKTVSDIVFKVGIDGTIEVLEGNVNGNTVSVEDGTFAVTDQYDDSTVSVEGTKTWDDGHNRDGKRPDSVTIALYNGENKVDERTVTAADKWKYSFTDLPAFTNGVANTYSVKEDAVPAGYTASVEGFDVTNTHDAETISVSGKKSWVDDNDAAARPESIQVNLYGDGTFLESKTVTADNGWEYTFENLPKYAEKDATQATDPAVEVTYTVTEKMIDGYVASVNKADIVNTRSAKTAVHVQKAWDDFNNADGIRPDSVTVDLLANGTKTGDSLTLSAANNWHAHFTDLDRYDNNGQPIAYTVAEAAVAGYTAKIETDENIDEADAQGVSHAYSIVNTHEVEHIDLSGAKTWDDGDDANGLRPDSIVVDLYANGEPYASAKVTPNAAGEWKYVFSNLVKNHAGQPVDYTVQEGTVPEGYEATVDGFNITNKHEVVRDVVVSKVDLGGEEIEGAQVSIKKADGSLVKAWVSAAAPETVALTEGDYLFHEEIAPAGYTKVATDIAFSVDHDGNVIVTSTNVEGGSAAGGNKALTVTDNYEDQVVTISKTDINGTEELEGAQLVVKKAYTGEEVASWTSGDDGKIAGKVKTHEVTLQPGTYVLTETTAPKGYKVAESITFTVDHLGKVTVGSGDDAQEAVDGVITMKDDYADGKVVISKTDVAGKEIAGAELAITNKDGEVVEQWTSEEGQSHQVDLYPGDYVLTETTAPQGYVLAESISFTVSKDGKVAVNGEELGKVTMVDGYSDQVVTVSKVNLDGKEIAGASIVVFDKDGAAVDQWTSEEGKSHQVTLKPGTYTFHEEAAPNGYLAVTDITFDVAPDGSVKIVNANGNTVEVDSDGVLVVTDQHEATPREGDEPNPGTDGNDDNDNNDDNGKDADGKPSIAKASNDKATGDKAGVASALSKTGDYIGFIAAGFCVIAVATVGIGVAARRRMRS